MIDHPLHVIVKFGSEIESRYQGEILLNLEKTIRSMTGKRIEVFKEQKGDDSKLRNAMTQEQRAKL